MFSEQYVVCNPNGMTINVDTVLLLSYAMAMLNTDLHNENVKRKMTVDDFINNLRGMICQALTVVAFCITEGTFSCYNMCVPSCTAYCPRVMRRYLSEFRPRYSLV